MISILQETEGNILAVKATGTLTAEDYEKIFIPQLTQLIEEYGKVSVIFLFSENFTGMELGAAWNDLTFGMEHRHDFEKIAVVCDSKWVEWATTLAACLVDGKVVTFSTAEYGEAISWVKK